MGLKVENENKNENKLQFEGYHGSEKRKYKIGFIAIAVFISLILLLNTAFAVTKTVNIKRADGTDMFCYPCYYSLTNSTTTLTGKLPYGASSFTFDASASSNYSVIVKAEMMGFNETSYAQLNSSENSCEAVFSHLSAQGSVAYVIDSGSEILPSSTVAYTFNPLNYGIHTQGYEKLKNMSYMLGFSSVNVYNAGANYSSTYIAGENDLVNYDVIVVGTNNPLSNSLANAVEKAHNQGSKVIISSLSLRDSDISLSSGVSYDMWYSQPNNFQTWVYFVRNESYEYPEGKGSTGFVDEAYATRGGSGDTYNYTVYLLSGFGQASYIKMRIEYKVGTTSHFSDNFAVTRKSGNYYVVPTIRFRRVGDSYYIQYTPIKKALLYLALTNYSLWEAEGKKKLTVETYEGTEDCGNIKPAENVLCCLKNGNETIDCDLSSQIQNETVQYESLVSPIENPELTARGDATDLIVFYDSEEDYLGNWFANYQEKIGYSGTVYEKSNLQYWYMFRDTNKHKTRISLVGSKGSTTGALHWLVNYDFYDVYMDLANVWDLEFATDSMDSTNLGAFEINGTCVIPDPITWSHCLSWIGRFKTCEEGDYWNFTLYYGINESSFNARTVMCDNGTVYRTETVGINNLTAYDDDFKYWDTIDWYYEFAPQFADFPADLIGYKDFVPMKKISSHKYAQTYNWIRHLIIAKFETTATGDRDTGAYIELRNNKLRFKYYKYTGGSLELFADSGDYQLECYAPEGYAFDVSGLPETYSRNVSLYEDATIGLRLQNKKSLRMKLHITSDSVEDIDNAKCSIKGFTSKYSTNGYCIFENVQPNKQYNITVSTSGANPVSVVRTVYIGDYYDSKDVDLNGYFCGNFNGTYTFEINIDHKDMVFYPHVRLDDETKIANAVVVNLDYNESCKTNSYGYCQMKLPYQTGYEYHFRITKSPYIFPKEESVYLSQMDCNKNDECSYIFYVQKNYSYAGGVNDDTIVAEYKGSVDINNLDSLIDEILSNPLLYAIAIMVALMTIGNSVAGMMGAGIGFILGFGFSFVLGLLPTPIFVVLLLISIMIVVYIIRQMTIGRTY